MPVSRYILTTSVAGGRPHISFFYASAGISDFSAIITAWAEISSEPIISIVEEVKNTTPMQRAALALETDPENAYGMTGQVFTANRSAVGPFKLLGINDKQDDLAADETIDTRVQDFFKAFGKLDNVAVDSIVRKRYFNIGK